MAASTNGERLAALEARSDARYEEMMRKLRELEEVQSELRKNQAEVVRWKHKLQGSVAAAAAIGGVVASGATALIKVLTG